MDAFLTNYFPFHNSFPSPVGAVKSIKNKLQYVWIWSAKTKKKKKKRKQAVTCIESTGSMAHRGNSNFERIDPARVLKFYSPAGRKLLALKSIFRPNYTRYDGSEQKPVDFSNSYICGYKLSVVLHTMVISHHLHIKLVRSCPKDNDHVTCRYLYYNHETRVVLSACF